MEKKKIFTKIVKINKKYLPINPTVYDLTVCGNDNGADIVLSGKLIKFEGKLKYGFKPSVKIKILMEFIIYEVLSTSKIWNRRQELNINIPTKIVNMSNNQIIDKYIQLSKKKLLPLILDKIVPLLIEDLTNYKPPVIQKANNIFESNEYISDVDHVPWGATPKKENTFAIIIGIESYRDLPIANFAVRDAKIMQQYLIRLMGFPEENIVSLLNNRATKGDIEGYIETWLKNNVKKNSVVFIYYAGHGAPDPITRKPYLIPYDANPALPMATGIPLEKIYNLLSQNNAIEL